MGEQRIGWCPVVGETVRVAIPPTHPEECTGHYKCVHGQTGRIVQINEWGNRNRPYYVIGVSVPFGGPFALDELEHDSRAAERRGE